MQTLYLVDVVDAESGMLGIAFQGYALYLDGLSLCSDQEPDRCAESGGSTKS